MSTTIVRSKVPERPVRNSGGGRRRRMLVGGMPPPTILSRVLKAIVLTVLCAFVVVPFVSVVSTSLADQAQVSQAGGFVLFPDNPSLRAYESIFEGGVVTRALVVSLLITVVGTAVSLLCTATLAYALSRPDSFAHKPLLLTVLATLLFAPGIIPMYLVVQQLGLLDSYWSLILPVAVNGFNVIVMRAFFMGLPRELMEAARIDGAGEIAILRMVVVPLSRAVFAVIGLFYAVSYWNAFFHALLYLNDPTMWPLQLVVRTYVIQNATLSDPLQTTAPPPTESIQMAILVISIVPILLVYPFLQKHFAKGVLTGAVKS
jgi:multiple sugar transport system permease protein/putative aldouronate transport system permease protein